MDAVNPQLLGLIDLIFPLVFAQQNTDPSVAGTAHHSPASSLVLHNVEDAQLNQFVHVHLRKLLVYARVSRLTIWSCCRWLFKCDDTLQHIANFWANLENILEHLRHRTGHVEPLINAAAKSANIEKLLLQRMGQYFVMWKQILRMCESMVAEATDMREDLYGFLRGGTHNDAASTSVTTH